MLTTQPRLVPRLKKESSYTFTPFLGLHGQLLVEHYFYFIDATTTTVTAATTAITIAATTANTATATTADSVALQTAHGRCPIRICTVKPAVLRFSSVP
jgi:hypothetical protein